MKYLTCVDDVPPQGECTQTAWVDEPTLFPDLSVEDGAALGAAVFGAFFVAWIFRTLSRNAQKQ